MFKFKEVFTEEERINEFQKVRKANPSKIPVIIEKDAKSKINELGKTKFLFPEDVAVIKIIETIRKKIDLKESEALFFLINGKKVMSGPETLGDIYEKNKDKDGFLYIMYAGEDVWGYDSLFKI